jgi:hypothetical protein
MPGDQRQNHRLGEQLPNHARAACTHGQPHRHLPLSSGSPGQEQIRNVDRGQEDDQDHRAHQHQQHGPDIADQRLLQRLHLNRPVRPGRIVGGVFRPQLGRERI